MRAQSRRLQLRLRAAKALIDSGFTRGEAIGALGMCQATFIKHCGDVGSALTPNIERNAQIEKLYRAGETLEQISMRYNLTRERVRQLLRRDGVAAAEGGRAVRALSKQVAEAQQRMGGRDARCLSLFGCDWVSAVAINDGVTSFWASGSKSHAYLQQRRHSEIRGVDWAMTFQQWWEVWRESGKWGLRGRGKDAYCMSRKLDLGGYVPGNVQVITNAQNSADSYITKPAARRLINARYPARFLDEDGLTLRQREIWSLWTGGLAVSEIAAKLGLRVGTVKGHVNSAKTKLRGDCRITVSVVEATA